MPRYSPTTGQLMEYQVGPYDSAHLYLQWGGKLPGSESWCCGLRLRKVGAGATQSGDVVAMLPGATTAITSFHTRSASMVSSQAVLTFVKLNAISTNGQYMNPGETFQQAVVDTPGAGIGDVHPNQIAIAVSLETGFSRGPAHAGRVYLPSPAFNMSTENRIPQADADGLVTSFNTLLANLNAVDATYEVAVFSRKAGAPGNRRVTSCKVGMVADTQRRRRKSTPEAYRGVGTP